MGHKRVHRKHAPFPKITEIESDFSEFISERSEIREHYSKVKEQFSLTSPEYKTFILTKIVPRCESDIETPEGLIDLYKFSERWWLYRYLSYSHWRKMMEIYWKVARSIIKNSTRPVVVDYGCGLGYISFEIGRRKRYSQIFLIDLDNLILEFANFHFVKHGIKTNLIRIDKENLYPVLPKHDVCILWEVFEHLKEPLKVFENLILSLKPNGLLCGSFLDHERDAFHVSPNLSPVRAQIVRYFKRIDRFLYRRRLKNEIRWGTSKQI